MNSQFEIDFESYKGHYSMTKAAISNMTKTAAIENIPHKIRVNAVCPTLVITELGERFIKKEF